MTTAEKMAPAEQRKILREGWRFGTFESGRHATPDSLRADENEWLAATEPCSVPCTVASALRDLGAAAPDTVEDLDGADHWFRCEFGADEFMSGTTELVFEGLATISECWLNDVKLGTTQNMFVRTAYDVTPHLRSRNELWICCRALTPLLEAKRSRARWRTRLASHRNLRFIRTTLAGRMPSWYPALAPVGPWRNVELVSRITDPLHVEQASLRGTWQAGISGGGRADVTIDLGSVGDAVDDAELSVEILGTRARLRCIAMDGNRLRATGAFQVSGVEGWWPHTHGTPHRYPVTLHVRVGDISTEFDLGPIAFRRIELVGPPGPDFGLEVNGERIFCRGTCWTPVDSLALGCSTESMRTALELARDAGMNMLRVCGNLVYESDDFYELCDELGILVWQDFMFATFDYPDDADFVASARSEARQFLERTANRVCLAVLCGNSEGQQQPAMLGLQKEEWANPIFDDVLPGLCRTFRPDIPYWPSTPSGGDLPFRPNRGTSHYFGVGAYRRPLSDALLARPRFMTECLALSNLPGMAGADTTSSARVPRDVGADWDFRDITNHYLATLYGEPVAAESEKDPVLAAALSRATSGRLMEEVGSLWRDPDSGCRGALVWLHRDPWDCSGWGVVDAQGRPKSAYFGLKRAWAPISLAILDNGLNGLRLIAFNDREEPIEGTLEIRLLRFDGTPIDQGQKTLVVKGRSCWTAVIDDFLGNFVDSSYAYRFGPRGFDLCVARLTLNSRDSQAADRFVETIHLHAEAGLLAKQEIGLTAQWRALGPKKATLSIATQQFAQTVVIELTNGTPADNFFHLPPGGRREISVVVEDANRSMQGSVSALNATEAVPISTHPDAAS